jgi:hypothetical protein
MLMRQIYEAAHEVVFDLGDFGSVEGQELDTLFESFFKFAQRRSKNMVYLVLEIPIRVTNPCARESVVLKDLDIARESCCNKRQICIW